MNIKVWTHYIFSNSLFKYSAKPIKIRMLFSSLSWHYDWSSGLKYFAYVIDNLTMVIVGESLMSILTLRRHEFTLLNGTLIICLQSIHGPPPFVKDTEDISKCN